MRRKRTSERPSGPAPPPPSKAQKHSAEARPLLEHLGGQQGKAVAHHQKTQKKRPKMERTRRSPSPLPPTSKARKQTALASPPAPPVKEKQVKVRDGMAGRTNDQILVYFALVDELPRPGRTKIPKMWLCPARGPEDRLVVARESIKTVEYGDLTEAERAWYLQELERDVMRRVTVHVPVLFANAGRDMMASWHALVSQGVGAALRVQEMLERRREEGILVERVSKSLSAANNTVVMLAAAWHQELSASGAQHWRDTFLNRVEQVAECCTLSVETIERYVAVGALMLKSPWVACLLPGFVYSLQSPLLDLLGDDEARGRMDDAFAALGGVEQTAPPLPQLLGFEISSSLVPADAQTCRKCKKDVVLYRCSQQNCSARVCWNCAGYSHDPSHLYPHSDQPIGLYLFCGTHAAKASLLKREYDLYKKKPQGGRPMSIAKFAIHCQAEEASRVVRLFSDPNRRFDLVPVAGDGWCAFRCVALALEMEFSAFMDRAKEYVDTYLVSLAEGVVEDPDDLRLQWAELDPEDDETVQALWQSDAGDHILPLISQCFAEDADLCIWHVNDDGQLAVYQNMADCKQVHGAKQINMLKTNPVMPHHDLLVPTRGYDIFRNAVPVTNDVRGYLRSLPNDLFHVIFNNAPADEEENDGKRLQCDFDSISGYSTATDELMNQLRAKIAEVAPNYFASGASVLRSLPGCLGQVAHTDSPPCQVPALGCVLALSDDTSLDVWPGAVGFEFQPGQQFSCEPVQLNAGDLLIFRGDLVHGGGASREQNERVHSYLEPADGSFQRRQEEDGTDVTHFMDDNPAIMPREHP